MTGEKDRYTTTEKLWKLDDSTLTTPKHDEMVLDLLDPDYVDALIPAIRELKDGQDARVSIRSEVPIKGYNDFIIGYIDIAIYLGVSKEVDRMGTPWGPVYKFNQYHDKKTGRPREGHGLLVVEVKPTVQSFGQTLRQLNTYRESIRGPEPVVMFLYTAETRFDAAFESQGIKVLHPIPRP